MRLVITVAACATLLVAPAVQADTPLPAGFETWVSDAIRLRHEARDFHDSAQADIQAGRYSEACGKIRLESANMTQAAALAGQIVDAVEAKNAPELADYQNFKADNDKWASEASQSVSDCAGRQSATPKVTPTFLEILRVKTNN